MADLRRRRIEPRDPGGEPICLLTAEGAHHRRAPIDRLLEDAGYQSTERGYEIQLARGEQQWTLANQFIEEEAQCCASFGFEVTEDEDAIVVRASHARSPGL